MKVPQFDERFWPILVALPIVCLGYWVLVAQQQLVVVYNSMNDTGKHWLATRWYVVVYALIGYISHVPIFRIFGKAVPNSFLLALSYRCWIFVGRVLFFLAVVYFFRGLLLTTYEQRWLVLGMLPLLCSLIAGLLILSRAHKIKLSTYRVAVLVGAEIAVISLCQPITDLIVGVQPSYTHAWLTLTYQ
jgi:hypothetical protein